ncbi:hypothetical protein HMI56_004971 [Coelomomyces lativittatus]|nr:hypothetical protein HMI56_004971 [Coelomomyces lativittatus]
MTNMNLSTRLPTCSCVYFPFFRNNTKAQTSNVSMSPASSSKSAALSPSNLIRRFCKSMKSPWTKTVNKSETLSPKTECLSETKANPKLRAHIQNLKIKFPRVPNPFKASNTLVTKSATMHENIYIHDSALVSQEMEVST